MTPMTQKAPARVFRFGVFELNEATGELRKHGIRVKLHSQPFQVLVMLLERPTELVTRDEMRQRLWGDDTIVDFDHGLNTAVNKLREALGDAALQPRHVETVSGRGYRFIAPVTLAAAVVKAPEEPVVVRDPGASAARPATIDVTPMAKDVAASPPTRLLAAPHELPIASRRLVRKLLLLTQVM
jgi:DNA-binding winged helix-turn-helix (wHTH) protein